MGEEEKKEIIETEESTSEKEDAAENPESAEESEDTAENLEDTEDEGEATPETEDAAPVAGKGSRGEPADKAKIAKLKRGIEISIRKKLSAGHSRDVAKSLAHIEARKKAVKLLGYIPKGFWADKD